MFIGWDWATETHDVTVMDDTGKRIDRWELAHTEEGFARTLARLRKHGAPGDLPVAIETTRGLAVDRLLAAGHPIVPVHPNAFHAMRARWGASKAKTDAGDSMKLADYLRTDGHLLPRLEPTEQATLDLQALTRQRADHIEARVAAANQLAALLDEHWPGGKAVFANLDSDIAMAFLQRYPTPASAARLTAGRLEAWCKRRGYSGKKPGSALIERLRSAPAAASRLGEAVVGQLVRVQVQLVEGIRTTIRTLDKAITATLGTHPYALLFETMPRIGKVSLGQVIGEIGPILERSRTCEQLITEAGVVPVTRASGKSRTVAFRFATNRRARLALTTFADNSRHGSDWAAKIYNDARARKKRHPHAVRILARAWLRVMWACWRDGTCYAPATHQANSKINTTAEAPLSA
ncbi:IS110 family transposase [Streptomyces olivoreticuli]|uniref:IS110 family transposase n=2 Tax=Streptomyces olivoreticuli TaxID=68246 RepID=UPI00265953FE|nr:IS110 family transposase [Streptomyces olivoreticuli]WKK21914.1 IS110 family transposase [Streptomyces olivoreticuli]WKK23139.1 IS110 family transposase [Streptomyces olivoreticuli]WKK23902.1 IS110 family transposase [Streptomyces olivoreticuli]WKK24581.1 IS110 family transposase [Streptomyces olivoreticuli]WKK24872.1 IS110 family transposase [Streptomyces olivoreticuli]